MTNGMHSDPVAAAVAAANVPLQLLVFEWALWALFAATWIGGAVYFGGALVRWLKKVWASYRQR